MEYNLFPNWRVFEDSMYLAINNSVLLVTYDITSLYTNLRFEEITQAMQKTLNEHVDIEYPIIKPENKFLVEIANIFLSNNEFTFHGKSHRQIIVFKAFAFIDF
jgi:hypothetical protein